MSLDHILTILEHYKYVLIFPIMIVEGPIITVISGFLIYLGFLNAFITFPLLIVGDLIGDCTYYAIGRYGSNTKWVKKIIHYVGYDEKSEEFLEKHFEKHTVKTLLIAKVSHGLGIPVQIAAGMAKVNSLKYIWVELLGTAPKTLFLLVLGFYLGRSYLKINSYLHFFAFTVIAIVVFVILYFILRKRIKNYLKEEEN